MAACIVMSHDAIVACAVVRFVQAPITLGRVGEDSLWIGKGELATSNAQQVEKVRGILDELGLEPATPSEAREMLGLKSSAGT